MRSFWRRQPGGTERAIELGLEPGRSEERSKAFSIAVQIRADHAENQLQRRYRESSDDLAIGVVDLGLLVA